MKKMNYYPELLAGFIVFLFLIAAGCTHEVIELEWNEEQGYRWAELPFTSGSQAGFEKLSPRRTGITFNNFLSDDLIAYNRVLLNGSGVAAGDINDNGFVDLYFTRLDGPNKLYRNLGGFRFEDITDQAGVAHEGFQSTGAVFTDVNGNGHLDLLISSVNRVNSLYINDGKGNFALKEDSGLGPAKGSMTMALADINGSGFPDLYITNYRERSVKDIFPLDQLSPEFTMQNNRLIPPFDDYYLLSGEGATAQPREIGESDELYYNNGDGTFTKAKNPEMIFLDQNGDVKGLDRDWGLTAKFQDLNGNGLPDLYVANDFWTPDRIWINQGNGTFREIETLAVRNSSYSSMAVDFSDINRNGFMDMFVVEMLATDHETRLQQVVPSEPVPLSPGEYQTRPRYNRNSLYLNRGDHTYAEISYYSGLEASDWSWATRFMDINLNGYEDIIVCTGFMYDLQDMDTQLNIIDEIAQNRVSFEDYILQFPQLQQQNRIFKNNGDLTFSDVSTEWGFSDKDISHGMALADLNNNGTLDLIINRMNDEAAIYRNSTLAPRVAVRLKGQAPNTRAIGARITLSGGPVLQQKEITAGGDYLSGSDTIVVFAANTENNSYELKITWPDGRQSVLKSIQANRMYEIEETGADKFGPVFEDDLQDNPTIFIDRSESLQHSHHEDPFDDFRIQPLLPNKLSYLGPGVALIDLTQDGNDELLIGTGKGGSLAAFRIEGEGQPVPMDTGALGGRSSGDQTAITGWLANGRSHLVVGLANYEIGTDQAPSALHIQLERGEVISSENLPGVLSTTGPVAAADYTGDGAIDLFIGGRFLPGQYPRDATSRLFRNENGRFLPDELNTPLFEDIGLVTGAMFVDYNLSGEQDLIISTEWGTIRVFENNNGEFSERTSELGLNNFKGWWQGIATGDFTGNGYPDIVASNMGKNSSYQIESDGHPLKIYYDDINRNGNPEIIEAYFERNKWAYTPRRQLHEFASLQHVFGNIRSHRLFAMSSVQELLGVNPDQLLQKEINTLEHMVFLNHGGNRFEARALPEKAQFSAGFYVGVADMDNNGNEDIFLAQNFFTVAQPQQKPRVDGGRGLWLRGDGNGNFEAVPGNISGVKVYGEQRGAALGDFTGDGRTDLIVSQNAADTRLFVNQTEKRGVRISLSGPSENSLGIGSGIRIVYEDGSKGPIRIIQAGSGYWSQNSATQVLGLAGIPTGIEVLWFDGTVQTMEMETGQFDYRIQYPDEE